MQAYTQDTTAFRILKTERKTSLNSFITPVALMAGGLFLHETSGHFNKHNIQDNVQEHFAINSTADDYLQYYPVIVFAALKTFGKEERSSTWDQLLLLGKSQLLMAALVYFLKISIKTPRPEGAAGIRSFPSGHTSMSFAAAHFLYKEYRHKNKTLVWSGYGVAAVTGLMRVMNNEHWISDIAFGAGLGILSTELIYLHHNRTRKKNHKQALLVIPQVGTKHIGFTLSYKFHI